MRFLSSVVYLVVITVSAPPTESARILGVFSTPSKSHLIVDMAVIDALVEKGHNVTVLTGLPLSDKNSKFRHIQLKTPPIPQDMFKDMMQDVSMFEKIKKVVRMAKEMFNIPNVFLKDTKLKKLMEEESFDIIVHGYFFNEFQLGLAAHFKCPIVSVWTSRNSVTIDKMMGNPSHTLYVPNAVVPFGKQPLRFLDRVKNVLWGVIEELMFAIYNYVMESYYIENFPPDKYPPYSTVLKNVSLVLANHHFSEGPIRSDIPALIEIGGIQVKSKPNPLPKEVQTILDGASTHGAIYFSLGSNAKSADLKPETVKQIYNVLSSLKQQVIWKWESDELPGKAANIYFGKWLPQDDILAHPNVKLFVTHGGKGSVVESEYHGVPMIGLPIFADQNSNVESFKNAGFGLGLHLPTLKEQEFKDAVNEILQNKKYSTAVKEFSEIYKDRPLNAKENAVFWIEYVIRHRGAPHIQSPLKHMNFFQRNGLDVLAFILVAIYAIVKVVKLIFCTLWRLIFSRKTKAKKSKSE